MSNHISNEPPSESAPLHITQLVHWLSARYRAAGGKENITDVSVFAEEVMRWTEDQHGIKFTTEFSPWGRLSKQGALQAAPHGMALVPLRLTQSMREVLDAEDWQWEDLLAAAHAITETQHNDVPGNKSDAHEPLPETMSRFCPGCGSVGEVPRAYQDCCPDGNQARSIPTALAHRCHDLFQLALSAAIHQSDESS